MKRAASFPPNLNGARCKRSAWLTRRQHATRPAYISVRVLWGRTYFIKAESESQNVNWTWHAGSEGDKAKSSDAVFETDRTAEMSRHVADNSR